MELPGAALDSLLRLLLAVLSAKLHRGRVSVHILQPGGQSGPHLLCAGRVSRKYKLYHFRWDRDINYKAPSV